MKLLSHIAIFSLISLLSTINLNAQEVEPKTISPYGLNVSIRAGLSIIINVNDVPVSSKKADPDSISALSIPINAETVPGKNKIEVLIGTEEIKPDASKSVTLLEITKNTSLKVHLQKDHTHERSSGVYVVKAENLQSKVWEPTLKEGKITLPQKINIEFSAPMNHPVPQWKKAKATTVTQIQDNITKAYRDIIENLQAGNADYIGLIAQLAYQDAAAAYPLGGDAESRRKSDIREIKDMISEPEMTIPDMLEPLNCKAYANGLMFECFAADGESPVRILIPNEETIYFTFRFSVIEDKLRVVR